MTKADAELLELMPRGRWRIRPGSSDRACTCGLSPRSRWKRLPTRVPGHARDFVREVCPEEAKAAKRPRDVPQLEGRARCGSPGGSNGGGAHMTKFLTKRYDLTCVEAAGLASAARFRADAYALGRFWSMAPRG